VYTVVAATAFLLIEVEVYGRVDPPILLDFRFPLAIQFVLISIVEALPEVRLFVLVCQFIAIVF
jgi:hypothetical protein